MAFSGSLLRRPIIVHVAVVLLLSVCLSPSVWAQETQKTKVVLAYSGQSNFHLPVWVARDQGFFTKHRLDTTLIASCAFGIAKLNMFNKDNLFDL